MIKALLDGKKNKLSSMLTIYKKLCIAVCPNASCDSMFCTLLFISELDGIDLSTWIWSASLVVCMPWRGVHSGGELASSWVQTLILFVEYTKMANAAREHYMAYIV
jgi:hypothetical protein